MNTIGRNLPINSEAESSSENEGLAVEMEGLAQQARQMQNVLQSRILQVQEMNAADIEALDSMNYLQGVDFAVQNLTERSQELNQIQQNLTQTLQKGENAVVSKQNELSPLQGQISRLKQQLRLSPQHPMVGFSAKLGEKVCHYVSNQ